MKAISSNRQRSIGIVLQYIQMVMNIGIQLIYTPFMLRILGANEYGIYNICSSTISYLSLISLGFGASYIRWYSIYKKSDDRNGIAELNGLYLIVFSVMGVVGLVFGGIITKNVQLFFNSSYSISEIETARVLMILLTINISVSFPASLFNAYITSQEKFIYQRIINIGATIISPIASIVFLFLGFGSIGMVVIATCVSVVTILVNVYFCFKKLRMLIVFRNIDWGKLTEIFTFSVFIAINQIIDQINWQTDKIVLGKIVNGTSVAVYSVGASLNTMFNGFSTAVSGVFVPKVNRIVSKREENMNDELTNLFIKVGRMQWFVLVLILSGFIIFGKYFVIKWAGEDYKNAYFVAMLLMIPSLVPLVQNLGIEIQRAKYLHKFRSIVYLIMAIFNVLLSVLFAYKWGEIGTAFATTLSILLANGLIMNIYYHKKCGINIVLFWRSICSTWFAFIAPGLVGVYVYEFVSFPNVFCFVAWMVLYIIIYGMSVFCFGLNEEEKKCIKMIINRITRKIE